MDWKKVETGNAWQPKAENESVSGLLTSIREDVGPNHSKLYSLETEDHKNLDVWGSTVLDSRMVHVKVGDEVKIVYLGLGQKQGGKQAPKLFDVFHRSPEVAPAKQK